MPPDPELSLLLGHVRDLVTQFKDGGPEAPAAFHEFTSLVFGRTILDTTSTIVMQYGPRGRDAFVVGGRGNGPLRLRNGHFLEVAMSLFQDPATRFWKVEESRFQYQVDEAGSRWMFRDEYARAPRNVYPAAHLHVRGTAREPFRSDGNTALDRLHFPTGRVSLEAIVRLLVESFDVPCDEWEIKWRRVLAESERTFLDMAHHPPSGPA